MSKGQITKARILHQAAELFNQQGYAGSSMSDVMDVTGLKKGGIYNHFKTKDELSLAAFDYAIATLAQHHRAVLRQHHHAADRLLGIMAVFSSFIDHPPVAGGCPLMNTAIEADDAHPALKARAQQAMTNLRKLLCHIVDTGIAKGELQPAVDSDVFATILISTIEGAIMISKLYDDPVHLERAIAHLTDYIDEYLRI
ncbi:HTH-type transcriptional repressor ComR [Acaryochloris thomasi RCC1774]|uniref:HTH-type transcriptional repressor ComR n=1 Tax=Acaryochloris thomasi RCC1774 TaxID=1764569 RepID=A0A2W1JKU4_9CYAN|nr:TetR/AcrR family transcriptional regulator [Acaryochloris thomasi]PZD71552.1 HTH-type transcriptional repressor ComR [Acaryochloris thomasi RCC1774]